MSWKLRIGAWAVITIIGASGVAHARIVQKVNVKGKLAITVCSQTEVLDCGGFAGSLQTDVFVSGEEFVSQSTGLPPETLNNLFVTVRVINSCTGEFTGAIGSLPGAASQHSLQSAELQGVVPLRNFEDDSPEGEMSVDVSLEGFGGVTPDPFTFRTVFEGPEGTTIAISVHNMEKSRAATPSGTLLLNGSPLACTFGDTRLMSTSASQKTVEHF